MIKSDRTQRSLEPRRTLLDELEDNRQRSSLSAPTPANIGISGSNNASPPAPIGPSVFSKEGLIQLAVPRGIIETEETYDLDVIAIHGLNGHPRDTWTSGKKEGQVFWLQDFLPKALPGARIYTYGYNSNIFFSKSTGDIGSYAKGLLDHLILERKSTAVCRVQTSTIRRIDPDHLLARACKPLLLQAAYVHFRIDICPIFHINLIDYVSRRPQVSQLMVARGKGTKQE